MSNQCFDQLKWRNKNEDKWINIIQFFKFVLDFFFYWYILIFLYILFDYSTIKKSKIKI